MSGQGELLLAVIAALLVGACLAGLIVLAFAAGFASNEARWKLRIARNAVTFEQLEERCED